MMWASLHYLPGNKIAAEQLGHLLDAPVYPIDVHEFPDGESLVRVQPVNGDVILFASLNNPDQKLIRVALAANALRDNGASRLILVAPYLCYMRQDKAFKVGEAISQRTIGSFLSTYFDRVLTVDPHLHRIDDLQSVFEGCVAKSCSATASIASALSQEIATGDDCLLVGPDHESVQWVGAIADKLRVPFVVGQKVRTGDRSVSIVLPDTQKIEGAKAFIVDDVVSSGATICRCADALKKAGAATIEVIAVHMLAGETDIAAIRAEGVSRIRSSDSVPHPTNAINLAPLLATVLKEEV